MNWPFFTHAIGVLCLGSMFAAGVWTLATSLLPQWSRIVRLALGNVEPVFHTLFPEASTARPVQLLLEHLDAAEAVDQPTREAA
jgi:hypothetical protein